jgi:MOSC domain-containing protein YiiM
MAGIVTAVSRSAGHTFTKPNESLIRLVAGLGVEGDAHHGTLDQHCSHIRKNPAGQPNLRQVHLIGAELHEELQAAGYAVSAGTIGENVTTRGIDLLTLPSGTRLHLGATAVIEITGLRTPCRQLDRFHEGLKTTLMPRDADGNFVRRAGVMSIVLTDGEVRPGDPIRVELPPEPHRPLEPV